MTADTRKHWENRATECRALADAMTDPGARAQVLRTAETYEVVARWQEQIELADWRPNGAAAARVVESCGANIRDHSIKMQRELNRRREGGDR